MGNGLSLKSNWLRFSCLKHCLGQALSCPRPSMVMNDDALASPNSGAQERHGWHSHAERGNDGKIEISLLEPSFWAAGAGQFEATTVALHLQMHPSEKL